MKETKKSARLDLPPPHTDARVSEIAPLFFSLPSLF